MSKLLEMHGISKSFYGTQALKDVDIKIDPGEIQAVCGENGAGKSTLLLEWQLLRMIHHYRVIWKMSM